MSRPESFASPAVADGLGRAGSVVGSAVADGLDRAGPVAGPAVTDGLGRAVSVAGSAFADGLGRAWPVAGPAVMDGSGRAASVAGSAHAELCPAEPLVGSCGAAELLRRGGPVRVPLRECCVAALIGAKAETSGCMALAAMSADAVASESPTPTGVC